MFKYIFERKWTFCKSRNVCGCSKALILFKDYWMFCVVQCSLTFVADEPGANRRLHRGQSLTMILTTMMMVIVMLFKMLMTRKMEQRKPLRSLNIRCNKLKIMERNKSYPKNIRTAKEWWEKNNSHPTNIRTTRTRKVTARTSSVLKNILYFPFIYQSWIS